MGWFGPLLSLVMLAFFLVLPTAADAQQSRAQTVPGGLPISWALTPFGDDSRLVAFAEQHRPRMWANQRERGLSETQLRALSWLGPGPWFNPGAPSGIRGAALVYDTQTARSYLLYEDGRTQLYHDPRAWQPF